MMYPNTFPKLLVLLLLKYETENTTKTGYVRATCLNVTKACVKQVPIIKA